MPPQHLAEVIESVDAQTHPRVELLIVDDGSTNDQTRDYLRSLERDGRTVIWNSHRGIGATLNAGVHASHGVYFLTLGDDLICPPYLAAAVEAMQADDSLGVVQCHAEFFGVVEGPWVIPEFSLQLQLFENLIIAPSLFRRVDWVSVGGFDAAIRGAEDYDFVLRVLGSGRTVHRLDETYFRYRRTGASTTTWLLDDRQREVAARAHIFRNNLELYSDHAELFWEYILEALTERRTLRAERNDLHHRYRWLERGRQTRAGGVVWKAARRAYWWIQRRRPGSAL